MLISLRDLFEPRIGLDQCMHRMHPHRFGQTTILKVVTIIYLVTTIIWIVLYGWRHKGKACGL
jgi:hypothetical protein